MEENDLKIGDETSAAAEASINRFRKGRELQEKRREETAEEMLHRHSPILSALIRNKTIIFRVLLILCILGSIAFTIKEFLDNQIPHYENVLVEVDRGREDCQNLLVYIDYIVAKVRSGGARAIAEKWIEGIPAEFQKLAGEKIALMENGYTVDRIAVDKTVIYNAQCSANDRKITFEIVKKRIANKNVFRLQNVY